MGNEPIDEKDVAKGYDAQSVRITTIYSDYKPPFKVEPIISRMLDSIPPKQLNGLSEVVLTNASGLSRTRRRSTARSRKRKVRVEGAAGLYHPAWHNQPAWIEIFVDNTIRGWEKSRWLSIPFIRHFILELILAGVLFHEVGHHIHYTTSPEYREKEDVADVWKVRLERQYYNQRFPRIRIVVRALKVPFGKLIDSLADRSLNDQLRNKWISRAEFDERIKD